MSRITIIFIIIIIIIIITNKSINTDILRYSTVYITYLNVTILFSVKFYQYFHPFVGYIYGVPSQTIYFRQLNSEVESNGM